MSWWASVANVVVGTRRRRRVSAASVASISNALKFELLRDQGLPRHHLNIVFCALVLSRLRYAIPAWSEIGRASCRERV